MSSACNAETPHHEHTLAGEKLHGRCFRCHILLPFSLEDKRAERCKEQSTSTGILCYDKKLPGVYQCQAS